MFLGIGSPRRASSISAASTAFSLLSLPCKAPARVVGVNVRKGHIEKCLLAKAALQLDNLELRMGDVREVLDEPGVRFDAVLCSGLLYHFNAPDVFEVMKKICDATTRLAIFDTHISLKPTLTVEYKGKAYRGHSFAEHSEKASTEEMELRRPCVLRKHGELLVYSPLISQTR